MSDHRHRRNSPKFLWGRGDTNFPENLFLKYAIYLNSKVSFNFTLIKLCIKLECDARQIIGSEDEKPKEMPANYPTMILMALIPPIWFMVMDKKLNFRN